MLAMVHSEWGGDVFMSCNTANSRGIVVMLDPSAPVLVHGFEVDSHGNCIIIDTAVRK